MASTPFGEHLRRERELRGVTLDEVAAATRIKTTFLEALESGRWEELPGGAFNRGFIRATSKFLGLDEDGMIAEYSLETGTVEQKPAVEPAGAMPRDYRPAAIALSVILVVLVATGWLGHHLYARHKQKKLAAAQSASVVTAAASDASSANVAANAAPSAADSSGASVSAPTTANAQPAAPASGSVTAAPSTSTPAVLNLTVEAVKKTDVKIVGDGKVLFKGRMHSDTPKTFEAKDGFEITAGEADRLHLDLNGQKIPFPATKGKHGSISLDRKDLKLSAASH